MTGTPSASTAGVERNDSRSARPQGQAIVWTNAIGTAAFALTAAFAAIVFSTPAQWIGAVTAMTLFAVGVAAFLWSFWTAVQRSREDQIGVLQTYLLVGDPTPPSVRRVMLSLLVIQIAVALVTAIARSEAEDGTPGTSLAVGILVPMLGLGLNGLWSASHGVFPPRADLGDGAEMTDGATSHAVIDKNDDHG